MTTKSGAEAGPSASHRDGDWTTLGRKAFATLSFRTAALPLSFATSVITSRLLLPEGRGAYALGVLTVTLAAAFLAIPTAVSREIGRAEEPVHTVVSRAMLLSALLGIVGTLVLLPVDELVARGQHRSASLLVLGLTPVLVRQTVSGALLAVGRMRLFNLLLFLDPAFLVVGLVVLVVGLDRGLPGAVAAWLIGTVLTTTIAIVGTRDLWAPEGIRWPTWTRSGAVMSLGLKAGVVNLVGLINYRIELLLLEAYHGLGQVGIYSVSSSLAELLWVLAASVSAAAVAPSLRHEESRAVSVVAQSVRHSLILTATFGVALGAVAVVAIPFVYGQAFQGSVTPLLILIPGVIAYSPAYVISNYFSMRRGRMRYPMVVAATSAIVNALVCLVLVGPLGPNGAATASTLGYCVGSALLLALFFRVARTGIGSVLPGTNDLRAYRDLAINVRGRFAR